jgi:hypothetical protein
MIGEVCMLNEEFAVAGSERKERLSMSEEAERLHKSCNTWLRSDEIEIVAVPMRVGG